MSVLESDRAIVVGGRSNCSVFVWRHNPPTADVARGQLLKGPVFAQGEAFLAKGRWIG